MIVDACLRDGRGGSPTLVVEDTPIADSARALAPGVAGASHAAFVALGDEVADVRFFTSTGELPACGHGTVAALIWLADRFGRDGVFTLRVSGRMFQGRVEGDRAWFPQAPVALREPGDVSAVLGALGLDPELPGVRAASTGRWRLLIPVDSRGRLDALEPDLGALRSACDAAGLLGCYVYTPPATGSRPAARMFAPSIGVPEDIANVNSTSCLLAALGVPEISVDMGDRLGHPATVLVRLSDGRLQAGGAARIRV
ncbi:PhzF family phenazine biosynthesis protein [Actinoplanes regularis]|uniref:Phenazine biosynthesis protein PhzF family n=1 Tax=Actinoplanes regularis TaxID=52697 RepID=A0A238ZU02_9ACTN|nr:PhzF family phenazine biosynthesis protein [Actinoplanes regularis]GIE90257.1 epimerase [Actinoplanes regularis]SNR86907.1 phenazine biosynthesis protein PhzF family [Actinoplanes regularis]